MQQIRNEKRNAEEAIEIAEKLLSEDKQESDELSLTRNQTAEYLQISMDTLRNWEMNGLLSVKRKKNGYRVYSDDDIKRLKIIRAFRCANYSLASILRLLGSFSKDPEIDVREVIDTPNENDEIISVCDNLLTSLDYAEQNAEKMFVQLKKNEGEIHSKPYTITPETPDFVLVLFFYRKEIRRSDKT